MHLGTPRACFFLLKTELGLELHINLDDPELDLPRSDRFLARHWLQSSRLDRVLNLLSRGALLVFEAQVASFSCVLASRNFVCGASVA